MLTLSGRWAQGAQVIAHIFMIEIPHKLHLKKQIKRLYNLTKYGFSYIHGVQYFLHIGTIKCS